MSSPLNFAFGVLGVCVVGGVALPHLVRPLSADRAGTSAAVLEPAGRAPETPPSGSTTLYADARGHFLAHPSIDGIVINALVDTGASMVALSWEDAQRIGAQPLVGARKGLASTANGTVAYTLVRLKEVRLNGIVLRDVEGAIMPKGALQTTLLGMSFLKRLASFEMRDGRLAMKQ